MWLPVGVQADCVWDVPFARGAEAKPEWCGGRTRSTESWVVFRYWSVSFTPGSVRLHAFTPFFPLHLEVGGENGRKFYWLFFTGFLFCVFFLVLIIQVFPRAIQSTNRFEAASTGDMRLRQVVASAFNLLISFWSLSEILIKIWISNEAFLILYDGIANFQYFLRSMLYFSLRRQIFS